MLPLYGKKCSMAVAEVVGLYSLAVLLLLLWTLPVSKMPIARLQGRSKRRRMGSQVRRSIMATFIKRETCYLPSSALHPTQAFFFVVER